MSQTIYPTFSKFDRNELDTFRELHPQYDTPENIQIILEFCALHCIPANLYNLEIAMYDAISDGRLEKNNREEIDAAVAFLKACPEYDSNFASRKNSQVLERWLRSRSLPVTVETLFKSFEACVKDRTIKPTKDGQGIIDMNKAIFIRNSVEPEDRERWADKPFESDVARKKRDEALRLAAIRDRIERRKSRQ